MPCAKNKIVIPPVGKRKIPIILGAEFAENEAAGLEVAGKALRAIGMFDN